MNQDQFRRDYIAAILEADVDKVAACMARSGDSSIGFHTKMLHLCCDTSYFLPNEHARKIGAVIEWHVNHGAQIDDVGNGTTMLMNAAWNNNHATLHTLIRLGANVNLKPIRGGTCLHLLSPCIWNRGLKETMNILLTAKPDLGIQDEDGNTPLHLAETEAMANLLLRHGAMLDAINNDGQYPDQTIAGRLGNKLREKRIRYEKNQLLQAVAVPRVPSCPGKSLGRRL